MAFTFARGVALAAVPVLMVVLAGCAKGNYYAVRPGEARQRLADSEIPVMVFGSSATAAEAVQRGSGTIVWRVLNEDDDEMMRLAAHVSADGDGSRIWTEVLPPEGAFHARVAKGMGKVPAVVAFYEKVAEEQVASVMAGRDFSMAAVTPAMMGATFAITQQIQQDAMHAASEAQKAQRRNIAQAYDDDAHGSYSSTSGADGYPAKYGEPMDGSEE